MARWTLLSLLLTCGCLHLQGAPLDGMEEASCQDPQVTAAARLAVREINLARKEGYVLDLHRLTNAHMAKQGENSIVFYLNFQVAESNCSVLNRDQQEQCKAQETPAVIGMCKAAILISRVHRVVRLYKYDCSLRPAINKMCPDCPILMDQNDAEVQSVVARSLENFNKDSKLTKHFALLKVTRASLSMEGNLHNVEYTIQETTCNRDVETPTADKCPPMDCEFAHRGFCRASQHTQMPAGEKELSVQCEIYEPEAAKREKILHDTETDHSHNDTHAHDPKHDHAHAVDDAHTHDHMHDHSKPHSQQDKSHPHTDNAEHHHTHDHQAGSVHRHAHDHSHDHGHGHDHVHTHHAKAHDHSADSPNHHHKYKHGDTAHTHDHDHELALDHDHKHTHLHEHEHHHHHHEHVHEKASHHEPKGTVKMLPRSDQPMTLPSFPDEPAAGPEVGVTLPLIPDPDIPGQMEPFIRSFPAATSANCPSADPNNMLSNLFAEDPLFKV